MSIVIPCINYLLKSWRNDSSYFVAAGFSFVIMSFNIICFAFKTFYTIKIVSGLACALGVVDNLQLALDVEAPDNEIILSYSPLNYVAETIPIVFLWVSDLFLVSGGHKLIKQDESFKVYRTWALWKMGQRKLRRFVIIPSVVYLASVGGFVVLIIELL